MLVDRWPLFVSPIARTVVAFAFHRPGLWILCRESSPPRVRAWNVVAAVATVAAMVVSVVIAPAEHRLLATVVTWGVGHVLWGTYLATTIARVSPSQTP